MAGLMGTQLKEKSATNSRSMVWRLLKAWDQQSGDQDGGEVGNSGHAVHSEQDCPRLTSVLLCRHESDTTDLYCIFDPDTAHRLAGWGRDWQDNHHLGQADFKVIAVPVLLTQITKIGGGGGVSTCVLQAEEDVLDRIIPGLTVLLRQAGMRCHPAHPLLAPLRAIAHLRQVFFAECQLEG